MEQIIKFNINNLCTVFEGHFIVSHVEIRLALPELFVFLFVFSKQLKYTEKGLTNIEKKN